LEIESYEFKTPGEYKYFCTIHSHMTGTIIVENKQSTARVQLQFSCPLYF